MRSNTCARAGGRRCCASSCRGWRAIRRRTRRPTSPPNWWRRKKRAIRCRSLRAYLGGLDWPALQAEADAIVADALKRAEARPEPDAGAITRHVFFDGTMQQMGGQWREGYAPPSTSDTPETDGQRINMGAAIRRTLETELAANPRVCVFGEDVGPKGGVHAVTLGLQERFGEARVFDTSLNEDGIVGRAVGMALAGLVPAPEIQFRKYADSAAEQIHDCGTMRWRTANRFAAPMVLRMPVGFFKCGDPWHSQTNEIEYVHAPGWKVAVPSNADDAVGLLRAGLRGNDPVVFFEHRAMLDAAWARRPWPGDDYVLEFGRANVTMTGDELTIVTWGAMVERCRGGGETIGPFGRGDRPAHPDAVGSRHGSRIRQAHAALSGGARGSSHRRLRRRDRFDCRRGMLPFSRRTGDAAFDARRAQPAFAAVDGGGGAVRRRHRRQDRRIAVVLMPRNT